jgi:hypothetical protein
LLSVGDLDAVDDDGEVEPGRDVRYHRGVRPTYRAPTSCGVGNVSYRAVGLWTETGAFDNLSRAKQCLSKRNADKQLKVLLI